MKHIITLDMKRTITILSTLLLAGLFAMPALGQTGAATPDPAFLSRLRESPARVEDTAGKVLGSEQVKVERVWKGDLCTASIRNVGKEPVRLRNIILFNLPEHGLDPKTPVYGEGFQKLAQNAGTLSRLTWRGPYPDATHYKIPEPDGLPTAYGMMTLDAPGQDHVLLAFTSCHRFIGRFSFDVKQLRISVDPEGLELSPGEIWKLEEFLALAGPDRNDLLDRLAADISRNHPPLPQPPLDKRAGWCTWYGVGGAGNQKIVTEAAEFFAKNLPEMKFIQVDQGYTMEGDLELVNARWGDMKATADAIKAQGMLPAIWVGPFIADLRSKTLAAHPDWYVQGDDGKPLDSSKIAFGGWTGGFWRALDGSNPAACDYLEKTFKMMREVYGVTYFKLDANYWGTIHGGKHFNPKSTRIEAYRRGMEAVLRGAGPGAVILGCNAPMWPSLGLVNAMRTGNDLSRNFGSFRATARENLSRGWQNGRLWVLDPDCVLLAGAWDPKKDQPKVQSMPDNIRQLHASVVHAAGGLVLSGDKIPDLGPDQKAILKKLTPPTGKTARFENGTFEAGITDLESRQYLYAFNWEKESADRTFKLKQRSRLKDFWTDEDLGVHEGDYVVKALPAQSARLITAVPETAPAASAQAADTKLPTPTAQLFPLADVKLLDPELLKIRELNHQYLLALDSGRLLRNYRENFGIKTGIPELTGHEAGTGPHAGARGHYTGHYLSACAMMIASTGDAKLKAKADALVAELAKLQQPNGYLSAQPEKYFDDLERNPAGRHIVWYCQHKLLAGLLDMYVQTGNAQALEAAKKFGDWVVVRTEKIDHDLMQKILHWEFGGIGEAMANLAAITGDKRYLKVARCFDHDEVLKPLAAGEDILKGHHGNTEIPKFIAAAREYELTGEEPYQKAAAFFWQQVALHRSYVTGGNTTGEGFRTPPDVLSGVINAGTQESCNTYNMLKLTEHLFGWKPDATAGDYYERALYNHILATPHPETGMPLYFLGLAPGQWKPHFVQHQSFWCCAGTGLENFSKLQRGIYYHGQEELWVNLFIASELDWKEEGVTIRQQTTFPNEPGTTLLVNARKARPLKINIRIPYWTKDAAIEINGKPLKANLKPGSFAMINRTWKDGDTVKVSLPMHLRLEPTPDNPNVAAVMVGPLVLAGELGPVPTEKRQVQPDEYNGGKMFQADPYPDAGKLALAGVTDKIEDWIEPVAGKPLTFKTKGAGRPQDFVLSPFYRLFDQRYNVYWRLQPSAATTQK